MKKNQYLLIFIFLILVSIILICSHNSSRIRGCSCEVEYTTQHKTSDTAGGTLLPLVDTSPQYLSESPVTLELFFKNSTIPKKIYQTYKSKSSVPQKVFENIKKYATEYDYEFFSDEDCIAFIEKYFPANVLTAYNKLENRAHKADLFRYCILYINGGIYLDIKTVLLKPLKDIFKENYVYSSISSIKDSIYQGVLASPPKNKFFLELIDYIVVTRVISYYLIFTRDFYTQILKNIIRILNLV